MTAVTDDGLIFCQDCRPSSQFAVLGYTGKFYVTNSGYNTCALCNMLHTSTHISIFVYKSIKNSVQCTNSDIAQNLGLKFTGFNYTSTSVIVRLLILIP